MIATTRAKLITAGRRAFASKGYADTAMEDLTADAALTRGALYHHFGGKKGLLAAVIAQIDAETSQRLKDILEKAPTLWDGFVEENVAWVKLALEPEVRRIVLLDGPAVLGDHGRWPSRSACLADTRDSIALLIDQGIVKPIDPEAAAYLVNGAALNASLWIAAADDPDAASVKAVAGLRTLLRGLRTDA
jgi:AcrR family transcriptional regulator